MDDGVGGEREEVAAGVGEAGEQANWWAMVVVVGWMLGGKTVVDGGWCRDGWSWRRFFWLMTNGRRRFGQSTYSQHPNTLERSLNNALFRHNIQKYILYYPRKITARLPDSTPPHPQQSPRH